MATLLTWQTATHARSVQINRLTQTVCSGESKNQKRWLPGQITRGYFYGLGG